MSFLRLDAYDATIRWLDLGAGDPILFLPGLSMPVCATFAAVAADPALHGRRCILLDYLGSGQSDTPCDFEYSLGCHVDTVIAVLDHLGISGIDVVGHSMGGTVGICLALSHPHRVRRLIVGEANVDPGGGLMSLRITEAGEDVFLASGHRALLADLRGKARLGSAGADRLAAAWQTADPRGLYRNARALVDLPKDFFDRFAALEMPKAFFLGEKSLRWGTTPDTPAPERLRSNGITPLIIPKAGHSMMLDNPSEFMGMLRSALTTAS
ncbi:alpha/beta fold hydrolase [Marivita sp. S0852]|uniref:alpha/beta fold hydrolase n=1 Tax=Marivita sp. S0852 TaxID=3373893 RepID=UPI0039822305